MMVIDGALRFARLGKTSLSENDFETAHFALSQSRDFVNELIGGLNDKQAPEIVDQLKGLFAFIMKNLAEADFKHDEQLVDNAIQILEQHRNTWVELAQHLTAANQPQSSSIDLPEQEEGQFLRGDTGHSWTT